MSTVNLKNKEIEHITDPEMVSEDGRYVTEEEYWEKYYEHPDFNYEWNNGILEEKPVSDYLNIKMYRWLVKLLELFLETYPIGKVVIHDFGFRLALLHKTSIRKPDLAVVLNDNPSILDNDDRSFSGTYNLCVELISDMTRKSIERDTVDKKNEYEGIGVKEYFIIDAKQTHMAFYRRNNQGVFEHISPSEEDIIQSEVLQGFQFRISDLFRQPSVEKMLDDELYQNFVAPLYRKTKHIADMAARQAEIEKKRADEEKKIAEFERKRADEEKRKADIMAAKLKELGISID
jgi:Uma2 family endonuclease